MDSTETQRDTSMLTWENTPLQGTAAIMEKLQVSSQQWSLSTPRWLSVVQILPFSIPPRLHGLTSGLAIRQGRPPSSHS